MSPIPVPILGLARRREVLAFPGYSVFIVPWAGVKSASAQNRGQFSGFLGGSNFYMNASLNDEVTWDIWLDAGTYKLSFLHNTNTNVGIYSFRLNGVEKWTVDGYGADVKNVFAESAGIAVSAGLYTFGVKTTGKNASSSGYAQSMLSIAWIRTGA